ncbi:MAG: SDR family NAD(P)-dependent oxidoreductase [Proteobacteria bacterium]|nr:SDR family NAD(P)-dependent oxidoreductase [Pseudomonadota bacterium]
MNEPPGRLQGRISVITGASRGLGAAIAKRFAGEGAHVVLVARTVGGLEEVDDAIRAEGGAATLVTLDLTEFDRIDEMGAALAERFGRIDVLVGNAGILGTLSPMGHIDTQIWDQVIAVNLTANWRLIRSFDPLLRASNSGRAIFVTSGAADGAHPYWGAYAASKAALEIMVKTWAGEVTKTPVKVNLVDPGALRTSMRAEAYPGEDPMTLKEADEITDTFVELAEAVSTRHGEIIQAP